MIRNSIPHSHFLKIREVIRSSQLKAQSFFTLSPLPRGGGQPMAGEAMWPVTVPSAQVDRTALHGVCGLDAQEIQNRGGNVNVANFPEFLFTGARTCRIENGAHLLQLRIVAVRSIEIGE